MSDTFKISQIKPLPGLVLVEPAKVEEKTKSGIYLPGKEDEKPQYGKVLAVGASVWESGVKEVKSPVKVGETVLYKKWGGNEFKIGEVEYQFLKFEDVLASVSSK
jgi:chaperonin GroES